MKTDFKLSPAQKEMLEHLTNEPIAVRNHLLEALQQLCSHDGDKDRFTSKHNDEVFELFEILKLQVNITDECVV